MAFRGVIEPSIVVARLLFLSAYKPHVCPLHHILSFTMLCYKCVKLVYLNGGVTPLQGCETLLRLTAEWGGRGDHVGCNNTHSIAGGGYHHRSAAHRAGESMFCALNNDRLCHYDSQACSRLPTLEGWPPKCAICLYSEVGWGEWHGAGFNLTGSIIH